MKIPASPPSRDEVMRLLSSSADKLRKLFDPAISRPTVGDRYLHWEELRFRSLPKGLTLEEWWGAIKFARRATYKHLPFSTTEREPFVLASPDPMLRMLSDADRNLSGRVSVPEQVRNPGTRDRYLMSAYIEEAITSSQLEGAATTRKVASEMLRTGRKPTDEGERMIWNNF